MFARVARCEAWGRFVRRSCGAAAVALAATSTSSAFAQTLTLEALSRSARETQFGFAVSCASSSHFEPTELPIELRVDRYLAKSRGAPKDQAPVRLSFLLEPPYACTPRADRLFTQSLDQVASASFDDLVRQGAWPPLDRSGRTGTYDQRKEWDRRAARHEERIAGVRKLLRERRWEDAHDALDELYPDRRNDTLVNLAELLLLSNDESAKSYGLRCLDRADDISEPAFEDRKFKVARLFGNVALKDRRWGEARRHFHHALEVLTGSDAVRMTLTEEQNNLALKDLYLALVYVDERHENYMRALNDVDLAIAIDPNDPLPLLHKAAMSYFRDPRKRHSEDEARKLFEDAYQANGSPHSVVQVPFPELLLAELRAEADGRSKPSAEVIAAWEKSLSADAVKNLPRAEQARLMLKSVELYAARSEPEKAKLALAAAEELDRAAVESSPKHWAILFALADPRTATLFGERFNADPDDLATARMLVLTLLDSSEPRERLRGTKLADLLHRANPDDVPLRVAAATAHFMHDRNAAALELVAPLVGLKAEPTDRLYFDTTQLTSAGYSFDRDTLNPFSPDDLGKVSLAQTKTPAPWDMSERSYPLVVSSPLAAMPPPMPGPAGLSPDDAYLVARILVRSDGGDARKAIELLENTVKADGLLRYREPAIHLLVGLGRAAEVGKLIYSDTMRVEILPKPVLLRAPEIKAPFLFPPTEIKPLPTSAF